MRKSIISLVLIILWSFAFRSSFSQSFTEVANLTGTIYGNGVWGDYDNDGDLDAFVIGGSTSGSTSRLYRYDVATTSFTYVATGITGIQNGSCAWGDFDNDGDLDLAIAGDAGTKISKIYRNNGGGSFTDISAGLTGVYWSTLAWGDYDNDGKLDLLVTGLATGDEPVAFLYHNDGNSVFTDSKIKITPCVRGMVKWGDYNNDDLLDIIMMGQDFDGNENTEIYKNDGNNHFVSINANIADGFRGGVDWGDYDNDGDLDVLIGGQMCGTRIYRNNGNDTFTYINAGLPALSYCPVAWGDYDNDGDLDIILAGVSTSNGTEYTQLFNNQGGDSFIEDSNVIVDVSEGSVTWGDYNGDGKIDLIITGRATENVYTAKIYLNGTSHTNSSPTKPTGIQSNVINNGAILTWTPSTDSQTPPNGLTYNVRIGTTTNGINILSPMSDLSNGYRRIPALGNAMQDNNYVVKNLSVGTYYWSVQAVDGTFRASPFCTYGSFQILPTVTDMGVNFLETRMGSSSWGDYDKDGDLDLLLLGYNTGTTKFCSKIYRNNGGGSFDTLNANLKGVNYGTCSWGDYDNDSDLDILIAGATGISPNLNPVSIVYRNNGNNTFTNINAGLSGVSHCSGAWGDYDNDGDLDILLAGNGYSTIYRNDGANVFTNINSNFTIINQGTAAWGDYDKDNDLDVLIFGTSGTKIYRNNGDGTFSNSGITIPGGSEGSAAWGDYNNDGYPDIFLTGDVSGGNTARIYKNNGNGSFTDISAGLRGVSESHGIWGDFNNDGYSDVFYTGRSGVFITKVYINNKDGTFSDIYAPIVADYRSKLSVADYDNNGDLDFFITRDDQKPLLYRNNMNFPNDPPGAPTVLNAENIVGGVTLSWNPSTDTQSTNGGLYYNIRLGTAPLAYDLFTPMVTPGNKRLIPAMGNTQLNTSWLVKSLPVGTYYWSVQAVDQGFMGGSWAAEKLFVVKNVQAFFAFDEVCLGLPTHFTDQSVATKGIASWLWDFGDGNTSVLQNPEHTYSSSGTFNVKLTITDTESATDFIIHSVNVKPKPLTSFTAPIICQGTATTFTNTTNENGLTIISWFWDFGDGQTSIVKDPPPHGYLGASDYNVTLKAQADNGCMDEISNTVSVASYPVAGITADAPLTFCSGGSVTLSVPLNASYSYIWKRDGVSITEAESNTYLAQATGSYTATVTNTIGKCITVSSAVPVVVNTAPAAPLISPAGPHTFCQGESVVLSVTSTPGYSYQWKLNGGTIGINSNQFTADVSGTYSVVVTNSSNCSVNSINDVVATANPKPILPTVSISGPTSFCQGGGVELSVATTPGYEYQWENNGAAITGEIFNSYIAQNTGNYTLKVSNSYGCSAKTENVEVIASTAPSAPLITAAGSQIFCQGDSVGLSVTPTAGYNYQWKLNGGTIGTNSNLFNAKNAGTYSLTVSNDIGCSSNSTNTLDVTVNPKPSLPTVNVSGPTSFCMGNSIDLSVTSTAGYTYQWENNGASISGAATNTFTANTSGIYSLRITNTNNCYIKTENVIVNVLTVPSAPSISASGPSTFCSGDSVNLNVTNTTGYTYQWRLNGGSVGSNTNQLVAKTSGSYDLVVSNSSGCYASSVAPVAVTVKAMPVSNAISLTGNSKFCKGQSAILSVPVNASYSYTWRNGTSYLGLTTNSIYVTESGDYTVEVSLDGCRVTAESLKIEVIAKPAKPDIDMGSYTKEMCLGEDPLRLSVDNIVAGYSYRWYKNETPLSAKTTIDVVEAGNYYLEAVTDICSSERDTAVISFAPAPPKPEIIVRGPSVWLLSASSNADKYKWYFNGSPIPEANKSSYLAGQNYGLYRLAVANESGCFSFSDTIRIPLGVTGIEDVDPFEDVKIYPNPTTGMFTIEMNNNVFGELIIDIFDQNGRKMLNIKFEKTTEHFQSQINLSGQSKGMYLINLSLDKFRAVRKLLVE